MLVQNSSMPYTFWNGNDEDEFPYERELSGLRTMDKATINMPSIGQGR